MIIQRSNIINIVENQICNKLIYINSKENIDNAINSYQKSIEFARTPEMTDNELREMLLKMFRQLWSYSDYEKQLLFCEEAIKLFHENIGYFLLRKSDTYAFIGNDCFDKNEYTQSLDYYKKAIGIGLEFSNMYIVIGDKSFKNHEYLNALNCYSEALYIDSLYMYQLFKLGSVLYNRENYKDAIRFLNVAKKICKRHLDIFNNVLNNKDIHNNPEIKSDLENFFNPKKALQYEILKAYIKLGSIYVTKKKYDMAIKSYKLAINIDYSYIYNTIKLESENEAMQNCFSKALEANSIKLKK